MQSKIYKYLGADVLEVALSKSGFCSFKCSYPKDFNDPYELFLTIDYAQDPDLLATYKDTIGELPQLPTTCFSKSPSVVPMWAHYSHNHRGVVVEFNENLFSEYFPEVSFGDVDYRDDAPEGLLELLMRACRIRKPRYHFLLQQAVLSAAYYTKHSYWAYEQERRLVARDQDIKKTNGIMLIEFPVECISAIIVGLRADDQTKNQVFKLSEDIDAEYYEMSISKTSAIPYFVNSEKSVFRYESGSISMCEYTCEECGEPLSGQSASCSLCAIKSHHKLEAAMNNPLRILERYGMLDGYYKEIQAISRDKN